MAREYDKVTNQPRITRIYEKKKIELQKDNLTPSEPNGLIEEALKKSKVIRVRVEGGKTKSQKDLQQEGEEVQETLADKTPMNYGQWLRSEREKRGWTQGQLANMLGKHTKVVWCWEENRAHPSRESRQKLATLMKEEASGIQVAKRRIIAFFKELPKEAVSGMLGGALLALGEIPKATGATVTTLADVSSIQDKLKPLDLHLQEDTIHKLIELLQRKQFDESGLRKMIEEILSKNRQVNEDLKQFFLDLLPTIQEAVQSAQASTQMVEIRNVIEELLSKDRRANEDLKQFFIGLLPTIQEAVRSAQTSTQINISGPVQGLIAGDKNTITQTFNGFLQDSL